VAVNVSARQFASGLVDTVRAAILDAGVLISIDDFGTGATPLSPTCVACH
jgi:EAL domain-containing protein (putative c-di-GMP-specific phosphodiesterase class I)